MVSWQDVIIVIILAYYWTAFDMFSVHKKQPPHIQPGYLRAPTGIRFFAGFSWPYTAYVNKEFAWFLTLFLSSSLTLGAGYILLGLLLNSISIKNTRTCCPSLDARYINYFCDTNGYTQHCFVVGHRGSIWK